MIRPKSITTKLRVVFNTSSSDDKGLCLNEACLFGPSIQCDLFDILIRFRYFRIAVNADKATMYRQVLVHRDDLDLQRIF